jgi:DNA-binding transcriptional regulator LsrR (DeoR family)
MMTIVAATDRAPAPARAAPVTGTIHRRRHGTTIRHLVEAAAAAAVVAAVAVVVPCGGTTTTTPCRSTKTTRSAAKKSNSAPRLLFFFVFRLSRLLRRSTFNSNHLGRRTSAQVQEANGQQQ